MILAYVSSDSEAVESSSVFVSVVDTSFDTVSNELSFVVDTSFEPPPHAVNQTE